MEEVFANGSIDAVIHFAGLKGVGESVREPLKYYYNNLVGTLNLIRVMDRHDVRSLVFSSSATVYGEHNPIPTWRRMEIGANNPYGRTKEQIEDILRRIRRTYGWLSAQPKTPSGSSQRSRSSGTRRFIAPHGTKAVDPGGYGHAAGPRSHHG